MFLQASVILSTGGVLQIFGGGFLQIGGGGGVFFWGGSSKFLRGSSKFSGGSSKFSGGVLPRNTVNVRPVRILLECILVYDLFLQGRGGAMV